MATAIIGSNTTLSDPAKTVQVATTTTPEQSAVGSAINVVLAVLEALSNLDPVISDAQNNFSNIGAALSNANTAMGQYDVAEQKAFAQIMKTPGLASDQINILVQESNNAHQAWQQASQEVTTLATTASGENSNLAQALSSVANAVSSMESVLSLLNNLLASGM